MDFQPEKFEFTNRPKKEPSDEADSNNRENGVTPEVSQNSFSEDLDHESSILLEGAKSPRAKKLLRILILFGVLSGGSGVFELGKLGLEKIDQYSDVAKLTEGLSITKQDVEWAKDKLAGKDVEER